LPGREYATLFCAEAGGPLDPQRKRGKRATCPHAATSSCRPWTPRFSRVVAYFSFTCSN